MEILGDDDIRLKCCQPFRKRAGIVQRQHGSDAHADRQSRRLELGQRLPTFLQRGRLRLEHQADRLAVRRYGDIYADRCELAQNVEIAHHQRATGLDEQPRLMRNQGLQNAAGQAQAALGRQIGVRHAGHINGLAGEFGPLLAGQLDRVDLGLKPFAPVLLRPAALGQEHRVTVGAAEGAAHVGIAGPVEAAPADIAGGRAED